MRQTHRSTLTAWQRRAVATYKLVVTGLLPFFALLGIIVGVAGYLGFDVLSFNGTAIHGAAALLAGPLFMVIACVAFATAVAILAAIAIASSMWMEAPDASPAPRTVRASSTSTTIIRPENVVAPQHRAA